MLAGHRVLITGGGSGVGADMALAFAAAGAEVVVAGRRREALDAVVAGEPRMRAIEADVSVRAMSQLFAAARSTSSSPTRVLPRARRSLVPRSMCGSR
jgi:short-subunit dehydrogenase involved in D-alanine esterification of teichoic acids